jgi:hypothetical protein
MWATKRKIFFRQTSTYLNLQYRVGGQGIPYPHQREEINEVNNYQVVGQCQDPLVCYKMVQTIGEDNH